MFAQRLRTRCTNCIRRGDAQQPALLPDPAAYPAQDPQTSLWELDPDNILIGDRIAVGGSAEVFVGKYEGARLTTRSSVQHPGS